MPRHPDATGGMRRAIRGVGEIGLAGSRRVAQGHFVGSSRSSVACSSAGSNPNGPAALLSAIRPSRSTTYRRSGHPLYARSTRSSASSTNAGISIPRSPTHTPPRAALVLRHRTRHQHIVLHVDIDLPAVDRVRLLNVDDVERRMVAVSRDTARRARAPPGETAVRCSCQTRARPGAGRDATTA